MKPQKRILLIEDDHDDQIFFLEAINELKNVTVYAVAKNGVEALEFLKNVSDMPDYIFSDIQMPLMDGIECLSAVKSDSRTRDIPFIILSTSVAHSDIASSLGAKAFIKKSADFMDLCNSIDQQIDAGFVFHYGIPDAVIDKIRPAA